VKAAEEYLDDVDEAAAFGNWRAMVNGKEVMSMPRAEMLRAIMLNHWYHDRVNCRFTCDCWKSRCR
jgi:hypothetical protein